MISLCCCSSSVTHWPADALPLVGLVLCPCATLHTVPTAGLFCLSSLKMAFSATTLLVPSSFLLPHSLLLPCGIWPSAIYLISMGVGMEVGVGALTHLSVWLFFSFNYFLFVCLFHHLTEWLDSYWSAIEMQVHKGSYGISVSAISVTQEPEVGGPLEFVSWSLACTTQRDLKILSQNQNRTEQKRKEQNRTSESWNRLVRWSYWGRDNWWLLEGKWWLYGLDAGSMGRDILNSALQLGK